MKNDDTGNIYHLWYVRCESKTHIDSDKSWRRNLYCGKIEEVIHLIKTFEKSIDKNSKETDWSKKGERVIKEYLRDIYKGYVRYHIYHNGLESVVRGDSSIEKTQHNYDKVMKWIKDLGEETLDWMSDY